MSCISKNTNSAANLYHSIEQREYRRVAEPPDKIWNRFGCSPRVIHTLSPWGELHGHEVRDCVCSLGHCNGDCLNSGFMVVLRAV